MKSLIAALAAAGLLPSVDMTDEAIITSTVNGNLPKFINASDKQKLTDLQSKVDSFNATQKERIAAKVKNAIETEKLVKAERKDWLTNMGVANEVDLDNYLEDLRAARPANDKSKETPRRGAPPIPPENTNEKATEKEKQMTDLQDELKACNDGARRVEISRELRELRGHTNLFEQAKAK